MESRPKNPKSRQKKHQRQAPPIDYLRLSLAHAKKPAPEVKASVRKFAALDISQPGFSSEENQLLHTLVDMYGLKCVVRGYRHLIPSRFRGISYDEALCEHKALVVIMYKLAEEISDKARFDLVEEKAVELANTEQEMM